MKSEKMLWTALLLVVVLCMFGCGKSDTSAAGDSLTIDNITPSVVTAGTPTTFTISVSYTLNSKSSGVINFGFGTATAYGLEADEQIVSMGTGTAELVATKTLTDPNTVVSVDLSEYPHGSSWVPLASAEKPITVNP